jgi:hypothetical protein
MNYLSQSGGADMMRCAAIAATESGHLVNCSVHDSFKVMAPLDRIDHVSKDIDEIMRAAGATVTGSFEIPTEESGMTRSPQRLADTWGKDAPRTWIEVQARLNSGELQAQATNETSETGDGDEADDGDDDDHNDEAVKAS